MRERGDGECVSELMVNVRGDGECEVIVCVIEVMMNV